MEQAVAAAQQLGYQVRQEWLGGSGGACEVGGRKFLFVDLSLNAVEQLDQVSEALRNDPAIYSVDLAGPLRRLLGIRRSA